MSTTKTYHPSADEIAAQDDSPQMDIRVSISFPTGGTPVPLRLRDLKRMVSAFTDAGVPDHAVIDVTYGEKGFGVEVFS